PRVPLVIASEGLTHVTFEFVVEVFSDLPFQPQPCASEIKGRRRGWKWGDSRGSVPLGRIEAAKIEMPLGLEVNVGKFANPQRKPVLERELKRFRGARNRLIILDEGCFIRGILRQ